MKNIIRQVVKQKLKQLTSKELVQYGKEYGFHLSQNEANQIITYIRNSSLDPFNEQDRFELLKNIASITDEKTAKKAYKLFKDLTKQYGIEDMF